MATVLSLLFTSVTHIEEERGGEEAQSLFVTALCRFHRKKERQKIIKRLASGWPGHWPGHWPVPGLVQCY